LVLLTAAAVATAGCRVRTLVAVDVQQDGSGTVTVAVGLDADAVARVPALDQELQLDDLEAAGWEVSGPSSEDDGLTWFRAAKGFATPEEADQVLAEVAGPEGPLRAMHVTRERSFARTTYGFEGSADLSGGLEAFGDEGLAALLEGEPLGEDVAAIEARLGEPLGEVFAFEVAVRLPGDVSSNAPRSAGGAAVWEPELSAAAPVEMEASSTEWRVGTIVWLTVAVGAALALIMLLVFRRRA
jgi:hypothetical protein